MSTIVNVIVPEAEDPDSHAIVDRWLKSPGDLVLENEPLVEVSTDKVSIEIPSPAAGRLREVVCDAGTEVTPGTVLGRIEASAVAGMSAGAASSQQQPASSPPTAPSSRPSSSSSRILRSALSPAVKRLLEEHRIDPAQIVGTGLDGRITRQDVLDYVHLLRGEDRSEIRSTRVPHTPMRLQIARHMSESVRVAPHVTAAFEADFSAVLAHRERHRERISSEGARLTLTTYLVAASIVALRAVPNVNARWHDEYLEVFDDVNIGVAAALERRNEARSAGDIRRGLLVPVIHRAQDLSLAEIAARLEVLVARARAGQLLRADVQGGTFTISNHGVSGSLFATPIINQPQSAILGVGKVQRRWVAPLAPSGAAPELRPLAYVTLTIDHRCLDGLEANLFLQSFVNAIESWASDADPFARVV